MKAGLETKIYYAATGDLGTRWYPAQRREYPIEPVTRGIPFYGEGIAVEDFPQGIDLTRIRTALHPVRRVLYVPNVLISVNRSTIYINQAGTVNPATGEPIPGQHRTLLELDINDPHYGDHNGFLGRWVDIIASKGLVITDREEEEFTDYMEPQRVRRVTTLHIATMNQESPLVDKLPELLEPYGQRPMWQ